MTGLKPSVRSGKDKYVNGPSGARCTLVLKKRVRQKIEGNEDYSSQVFGFEYTKKEVNRAIRFQEQYPDAKPLFPLIEQRMNKAECLYYLEQQGIKRPRMYAAIAYRTFCFCHPVECVREISAYLIPIAHATLDASYTVVVTVA